MDDIFFTPETRLATVLRINSEIISSLASVELMEENIEVLTRLLDAHSNFVLSVSDKVIQSERLDIKSVK
jgi:hypothetical protein